MGALLVFVGGGTGAVLRYGVGRLLPGVLATFAVNLVGCLLMGALAGWLLGREQGESWRLLLGVGVLGGFTTFSAFALDVAELWRGRPEIALSYMAMSVLVCLGSVFVGGWLTRP